MAVVVGQSPSAVLEAPFSKPLGACPATVSDAAEARRMGMERRGATSTPSQGKNAAEAVSERERGRFQKAVMGVQAPPYPHAPTGRPSHGEAHGKAR